MLTLVVALAVGAEECRDKTGIRWTMPFPAAHQRASAEKRLLLVKPIAFGTSKDGGW